METLGKSVERLIRTDEFRKAMQELVDDPSQNNGTAQSKSVVVHVDDESVTIRRATLED